MIIALDGPAGAGKSTIASLIAKERGFFNLNSGSFYRAVTYKVLNENADPENIDEIIRIAQGCSFDIRDNCLYLDGENVEVYLRTPAVDRYVAAHSAIIPVRHIVNENIRRITAKMNVVAEGRDMTTVVFPHADLKFYIDASVEARAERRYLQNHGKQSVEEIRENIKARDEIDKNKEEGSLIIAEDALYLDTSDLTLEQVYERVLQQIQTYVKTQEKRSKMAGSVNIEEHNEQSEMQEKYLKAMDQIEEGQLVEGIIVQIDGEFAYIDIGYKSEGKIPLEDFDEKPEIGAQVEVMLIRKEGRNGQLVVSKQKADAKKSWKDLRNSFENNEPISAEVVSTVKGGFEVDLGHGIRGFVPLSKMDLVRIETPDEYVGLKTKFVVERLYQDKKVNIVLSRKKWLEEEAEINRSHFFETVRENDIVEGTVKSFTSFGAFIDLGGFDGLLHINDMGWGHVTKPKDFVKKGQKIKLKVVQIDQEEKKINLSLKELTPNPWDSFGEKYQVNDIVKGTVTKLTDFGAFIEIEKGIEGLAHISELSWVKRIKHPREILNPGDEVEVMILDYNIDEHKIALGVKQVQTNPWESMDKKFPVGKRITGRIVKVINSGAFVELEEGIEGFIHIDDYSWTQKPKSASSIFKKDDEIEAIIIDLKSDSKKIKLGVKQLEDDPWAMLERAYPKGSLVEGTISGKTDFGLFVTVQGGIEALIHKNNLILKEDESPDEALTNFKEGDSIKAIVMELNSSRKKLSLSMKEMKRQEERQELSRYLHDDHKDNGSNTFTLGDLIKNQDS